MVIYTGVYIPAPSSTAHVEEEDDDDDEAQEEEEEVAHPLPIRRHLSVLGARRPGDPIPYKLKSHAWVMRLESSSSTVPNQLSQSTS